LRRGLLWGFGLLAPLLLSACFSIGTGSEAGPQLHRRLVDAGAEPARRAQPLVDALLIQPLPADALADTVSIAYSQRSHEFAFYQLATWTERPVRQLPRLLQRRLEARGVAAAVGLLGEPLRADWLLTLAVDTLHHDVSVPPGQARLAVTVELFDRRNPARVARRSFTAGVPTARADSAAAATAMSQAVAAVFDEMLPWLEDELQRATAKSGP
jgi:ABC-type uncharacterized transport system auxiliary subunit